MLRRQYKVFLILFCIAYALGIWGAFYYHCKFVQRDIADTGFAYETTDEMTLENVPLLFTFRNDVGTLHCLDGLQDSLTEVTYYTDDDEQHTTSLDAFSYEVGMTGTMMLQAESTDLDMDGDGTSDTLLIAAKSQTVESQGYNSVAYNNHTFGDPAIPVEICYVGSNLMSTDVTVLVYGEPYTGTAHLQSVNGKDQEVTITDGLLTGMRIQDMRYGMALTIYDETQQAYLQGTYTVEDYPQMNWGNLVAMSNFLLLIPLTALGCAAVCAGRALVRRYHLAERIGA